MEGLELSLKPGTVLEVDKLWVACVKVLDAPTEHKARARQELLRFDVRRIGGREQLPCFALRLGRSKQTLADTTPPSTERDDKEWNETVLEEGVVENDIALWPVRCERGPTLASLKGTCEEAMAFRMGSGIWIALNEAVQLVDSGLANAECFRCLHEL